jgi:tRNA U34 2-thiouridine synthase MnmA/TrmU
MIRAVSLISGGLDSALATKLMKNLGIEVIGLNLKTPFGFNSRDVSVGYPQKIAQELGIKFKIINVIEEFFEILKNPKYGYGSNMNPCIDCKILFFRKAKEFMLESDAKFIFTGEVLGQRPMSQHKRALRIIDKDSGLEGLVLRPLSAKLLPQTMPEKENWVRRDKLLSFSGRTRKPQIELAKELGVKYYLAPAGGCLLTDLEFAKRTEDLIACGQLNINNIEILKLGRHFRFSKETKLAVGRNEKENECLFNLARDDDYLFKPLEIKGPTALGRGTFDKGLIKLSCSIVLRYCDLDGKNSADILYSRVPQKEERLNVLPIKDAELIDLRI